MNVVKAIGHATLAVAAAACIAAGPAVAQSALGTTKNALDGNHAALCSGETAFGNVIANAMKDASGSDVALINCGAIKSDQTFAAASELTEAETAAALPNGKLVVVELTGQELLAALEHGFGTLGQGDGRFLQVAGVRLDLDGKKPMGQRIRKITINGAALQFNRSYRIAAASEMLGVDAPLATAKVVTGADKGEALADVLSNYIRKKGIVDVKAWGRIEITQ